jgi:methionyl-tRNA formyltransferase
VARIAVAATAPFGADVLEQLASRHEVVTLLTRPDAPRGRGRKLAPPPAKVVAESLRIPVLQPARLTRDVCIHSHRLDAVVVAAYGLLIPEELLTEPLWLNVHPSLLPRWRGAAPVERALMAGDPETGVTIHETVKELDAGPIAAQRSFPIGLDDDAGAVFGRAAGIAADLLDDVFERPVDFLPQPEDGVTYADKITAADRELDLSRPALEAHNHVRALSPHIGARATVDGRRLTIWRTRVVDGELQLLEVQPEGRRRMTYAEYLRGLR